MKFIFYVGEKKKKNQVIKVKTNEELMTVAKIAKCELTKNSILKDLDFSAGKLMCLVKDKELSMKELWAYLEPKLRNGDSNNKIKDDTKKKKKNKDSDKKKNKKKKKSSVSGEKKSKKDKKKKKKSKEKSQNTNSLKKSNGLVHITRR